MYLRMYVRTVCNSIDLGSIPVIMAEGNVCTFRYKLDDY